MAALGADEQQVYRGSTGAETESAVESPRPATTPVTKREWLRNSKGLLSAAS